QPGQPGAPPPASRPSRTPPEPWGRDYGKDWSSVSTGRPSVNKGQQAKHDPNHHYFKQGRSEFTHTDPQALVNKFAGTGQPANSVPRGQAGFRERVDFGERIGRYNGAPTQKGIIHYAQDGTVHIVPAAP
ncbi:MAG TPA: polymorphic toxin type 50 domain-containing protein, partial [Hyphomonadaceae bacterium]|nr:polymorphic toxin type 50 domain-containing protein [Hyphomonadaceae bacterium]